MSLRTFTGISSLAENFSLNYFVSFFLYCFYYIILYGEHISDSISLSISYFWDSLTYFLKFDIFKGTKA
jgi:hypothetical protein